MNNELQNAGIERAAKIVAAIKVDIANYLAAGPSPYRDQQIAQLRKQLARREQMLADLKNGSWPNP